MNIVISLFSKCHISRCSYIIHAQGEERINFLSVDPKGEKKREIYQSLVARERKKVANTLNTPLP